MSQRRGAPMTLRVVTRPDDGLGFRLAGVPVDEVPPGAEAERFHAMLADPAIAVLAVETDVLAAVPPAELDRAARRGHPVVLSFTLPRRAAGPSPGRAYVAALLRRAIGYHVKLEGRR
jgi:V/A-type H+-transporting ATPase subunit F